MISRAEKIVTSTSVRSGAAPQPKRRRRRLGIAMSLAEAVSIAGSLGVPSKMPGYSYGLDARRCHRGSEMAKVPGSICRGCFALHGFYATWRPALVARERRHAGLEHPRWVDAMVRLINHYCLPVVTDELRATFADIELSDELDHKGGIPFFRWHDSGDLQGVWHLENIVEVCERTEAVRHWLPTREYEYVAAFRAAGGVIPDNLVIRLSALMLDTEPVIPAELADLPTSTVHTPGGRAVLLPSERRGAIACRALEVRNNVCGPCRACWDRRVSNVSYPEH